MKIVLSRKGFDSKYGGTASPAFKQDNSFISLPIPAENADYAKEHDYKICYRDLNFSGHNYGKLIDDLFRRKTRKLAKDTLVHLDPDIIKDVYSPRDQDWIPLFGQDQPAQSHLRIQKIGPGDIFLFFGLFRWVKIENGVYKYISEKIEKPFHMLWGWMQVGKKIELHQQDDYNKQWVSDNPMVENWMKYHPHFAMEKSKENTLYVGNQDLIIDNNLVLANGGAGSFKTYREELQLTAKNSNLTDWLLPSFFYSEDQSKRLSCHPSNESWKRRGDKVSLKATPIGQEFILDCLDNNEAIEWLIDLISNKANRS
jgi:hypothetical protein